jgi:hypothetical protein
VEHCRGHVGRIHRDGRCAPGAALTHQCGLWISSRAGAPTNPLMQARLTSLRRACIPSPYILIWTARGLGLRSLRLVARIAAFQAAEDGSKPSGSASVPEPKEAPRGRTNFGIGTAVPLRLTAGCRTLNAVIVVRIHEGEPFIHNHAGVAQRSRAALSYGEGRLFKSTHRHQPYGR